MSIHPEAIQNLLKAVHGAPFDLLGAHQTGQDELSIRAFRPTAERLFLITATERHPMNRLHDAGFFEVTLSAQKPLRYHLEAERADGSRETFHDPYAFPPFLSDYDLYLLSEGRHYTSYDKLGAHPMEVDGVRGVGFAVWAPNAYRVSIIGEFNDWDARVHPMLCHAESGIWELFIPDIACGLSYKYDIRSREGDYHTEKADPYAFFAEQRPRTASVIVDLEGYTWGDAEWMAAREAVNPLEQPISIYEAHLGSWRRDAEGRWLSYRQLADELVPYVKEMGFTHIELMPVAEHPFDGSWGYQVTGYYAPTSRYGTHEDFMAFVDACHQQGVGVILDWVPAHFPKDGYALSYFDGTHLYEHADPRKGEHPDWGTYIFNYGRNEVRNFLLSNALFWLKKYHIDGLRVDAVSSMVYLDFSRKAGEWLPNQYGGNENLEAIEFLKEMNTIVHQEFPGAFTIAEESTAWPMVSRPVYLGGLGFTFKWNMGWMHDTLQYMQTDPVYRRYHHYQITFSLAYAFTENFVLSLSHDEVVHLKGSLMTKIAGDWWQKFASLRLLFGFQFTHPGKKLNFMGQEFGQWSEWNENQPLDWGLMTWPHHAGLQRWLRDLNLHYRDEPALYERDFDLRGFQWIESNDSDQSVFSYIRIAEDANDFLVVVANFTPIPRYNYRVGVPAEGRYQEILNSDSELYGGGNIGNQGETRTDSIPWHAFDQSLNLTLPPLGIVILKPI